MQNFQELEGGNGSISCNALASRKLSDLLIPVMNSQGNKPRRSVDLLLYDGGEVWCWQGGGRCAVLTFATSVVQGVSTVHEKLLEYSIF